MNMFILDKSLAKSAQYTCDKHVVKMITEQTQLLSSVYYFTNQEELAPYKLSHKNHPLAKWARESRENWLLMWRYTLLLYGEYKFRYENKLHGAGEIASSLIIPNLKSIGVTDIPIVVPKEYNDGDLVSSYRKYYINEKQHILKYTKRDFPDWLINLEPR